MATDTSVQRMVPGGPMLDSAGDYWRQSQMPGSQYVNEDVTAPKLAQQAQVPGGPFAVYTR